MINSVVLRLEYILLTGEYLDVTVAVEGVEDSWPFTCIFWSLGVIIGGVDAGGIVGDGHFCWETCKGARGVVDDGGNIGFCKDRIWVVDDAVVVSGVKRLSNSTPLTNGGVIDTGSLVIVVADKFCWLGSEDTLPGNSSKKISYNDVKI